MLGKSLGYLGPMTLTVLAVEADRLSPWHDSAQSLRLSAVRVRRDNRAGIHGIAQTADGETNTR